MGPVSAKRSKSVFGGVMTVHFMFVEQAAPTTSMSNDAEQANLG
ncbi:MULTISPECIES: hypothetical protein [Dyella]|nr:MULTISPECIES: hypothetical protein [Dyella]